MSQREKIKQSDIKDLISLVEARPAIYNSSLKEHNDKRYIEECWKSIGDRLKCKPSECRIKWTVLRNSYSRNLRREALTCSRKTWYLADAMSFLKNHMRLVEKDASFITKTSPFSDNENQSLQSIESNETESERSKSVSNNECPRRISFSCSSNMVNKEVFCFESNTPVNQEDNTVESKPCIDIDDHTTSEIPMGQISSFSSHPAYANNECSIIDYKISHVDNKTFQLGNRHETQSESSMTAEDDADMLFLKSMYKDLRKLSSSRKRRFKIEIMTSLYKHLDEEEKDNF